MQNSRFIRYARSAILSNVYDLIINSNLLMLLLVLVLLLLSPHSLLSKTEYEGIQNGLTLESSEINGQILKLSCDYSNLQVEAFDQVTIKVSFFTDFVFKPVESYYITKKSENIPVSIKDYDDYIIYKTDSITLKINKNPLLFEYYHENKLLLKDTMGFFKIFDYRGIRFKINPDEVIYGGGSRALPINRRGNLLMMWNQNKYGYDWGENWLNHCIPFLISTNNYGLFFDNPSLGFCSVDEKSTGIIQYHNEGGQFRYLFIYGKSLPDIQSTYLGLTGKQPLPPLWSLGYLQAKFYYQNQEEVMTAMTRMRAESFPVDAVIHDFSWMGGDSRIGDFEWSLPLWPKPQEMLSNLNQIGIKNVLITEPLVCEVAKNYDYAFKSGFLTPDSNGKEIKTFFMYWDYGLIDIFKTEARDWFWSLYSNLTKDGLGGWWCDLGEPDGHPIVMRHSIGLARDVHSLYCLYWSKMIYEGYQKDFPKTRPFILSRAASPGIQKYGVAIQCGDAMRSYSQIKTQISILLASGLCGLGYMHSDVGGFAGSKPTDNELYVRWAQFGVFNPVLRAHSSGALCEPIYYNDTVKSIVRPYFNLRYQLLPYNYTLAWENTTYGYPLARQMNFFEDRKDWQEIGDQYLWGSNFLVAPVYDSAARTRTLILPPGKWIDFWDNTVFQGDRKVTVDAPLEKLPLFVKSGSIIPMANQMLTTAFFKWDTLTALYYPDKDVKSYFKMYEDDGITPEADKTNSHQFLNFYGESTDSLVSFRIARSGPGYNGSASKRQIILKIPFNTFIPDSITINSKAIGITYSFDVYNAMDQLSYINTKDSSILVKFNWSMDSTEVKLYELTNIIDTVDTARTDDIIFIFPNPFLETARINIHIKHSDIKSMRIVDIFGREVCNFDYAIKTNNDGDFYWDGRISSNSYTSPGVYLLIIDTQHGKYVRKIVFNGR